MYYSKSDIRTYADAEKLFKTARTPSTGKPIRSFARILKDGNDYIIAVKGTNICRITPDNTLEFIAEVNTVRCNTFTLVGNLHSVIPIAIFRVATGRYRVEHSSMLIDLSQGRWPHMKNDAPEYFQGIKFDLTTGQCLNRREDMLKSVDTNKRKEWLRLLTRWNRGIKVRMKMGVFTGLIERRRIEGGSSYSLTEPLYYAIIDGTHDTQLLYNIVLQASPTYWNRTTITPDDVQRYIKNLQSAHSIYFRQQFGVLPK
jgi:hypothetical protein